MTESGTGAGGAIAMVGVGTLAIIIYAIVESTAGRKTALITAFFVGLIEAVFSIVAAGGFDYITILVFLTITILIGVSLLKKDDIYYRLSPAIANVLVAVVLIVLCIFMNKPLLVDMFEKYGMNKLMDLVSQTVGLPSGQMSRMMHVILEESGKHLPFWLLIHAAIIWFAATKLNKWWWVAANVGGLFPIMLVGILIVFIRVFAEVTAAAGL